MDRSSNELELPITMPLSFGIVGNSSYSSLTTSKNLPLPDLIVEQINAKGGQRGKSLSSLSSQVPPAKLEKNFNRSQDS